MGKINASHVVPCTCQLRPSLMLAAAVDLRFRVRCDDFEVAVCSGVAWQQCKSMNARTLAGSLWLDRPLRVLTHPSSSWGER
jgi:hypothetical protein